MRGEGREVPVCRRKQTKRPECNFRNVRCVMNRYWERWEWVREKLEETGRSGALYLDTERKEEYKRVESGFSCVSNFISVFVWPISCYCCFLKWPRGKVSLYILYIYVEVLIIYIIRVYADLCSSFPQTYIYLIYNFY